MRPGRSRWRSSAIKRSYRKKPAANRLHPAMKPIELIERELVNGSRAGEIVLDPFAGSGSTLIACEKNSSDCRTLELDSK